MCQNPLSFLNKWCWCSNCTFYSMSLPLPSGHCQWKHLNFSFRIVATFTCTTAKVLHSLCAHRYSLNVYFAKMYFFLTISFHVCSWLAVKTHQSHCIFSIRKFYRSNICCMVHFSTFYWDTSATMPCTVALSWASTTSDTSSSSFLFSMLDTNWIILDSQLVNLDCRERGSLCIRLKSCTVTYHFIAHGGTAKKPTTNQIATSKFSVLWSNGSIWYLLHQPPRFQRIAQLCDDKFCHGALLSGMNAIWCGREELVSIDVLVSRTVAIAWRRSTVVVTASEAEHQLHVPSSP